MKRILMAFAFVLAAGGAIVTHAGSAGVGNVGFQNPDCQQINTDCSLSGAQTCNITVYSTSSCQTLLTRRP